METDIPPDPPRIPVAQLICNSKIWKNIYTVEEKQSVN